ncbi:MAG: hypothetical protein ABI861_06865 [Panacibacter sp.]
MASALIEELRALRKEGKLIPFVAAGLSMNPGLPSTPEQVFGAGNVQGVPWPC